MPKYHISDNMALNAKQYINATGAKLEITSMATNYYVEFPAFLTDFSQTFDATWNTEDVYGRMDPIATYQSTKRTMSLGFDLPAGSIAEAKDNLANCSMLTKMVYPVYSNDLLIKKDFSQNITVTKVPHGDKLVEVEKLGQIVKYRQEGGNKIGDLYKKGAKHVLSKPPLVRVKFANLIDNQGVGLLGWISGLSWKPNLEMGMFTENKEFFPKIIGISFSFNILHEQRLDQQSLPENWPFGG